MGDGRWEDGAHSLDQLSSGAIDDDEETVEVARAQYVELKFRWRFCVLSSTSPELYL
jgi:hypothetical protein